MKKLVIGWLLVALGGVSLALIFEEITDDQKLVSEMVVDESQAELARDSVLSRLDSSSTNQAKAEREGFQSSESVSELVSIERVSSEQSHTAEDIDLSSLVTATEADEDVGNLADQQKQIDSEPLPGEEIEYSLQIAESSFYDFKGQASSTIGNIGFDSQLLPSNEVRLMLQLTKDSSEPVTLNAYFDLANFSMELDGGNAVLDQEHKELLHVSSAQLTDSLVKQYDGYEVPEHGFMLIQMLSYWSKAPEGYVHEAHASVSR